MPSTVPLLVGFTRPENSTDNTGSDFVVGAWIPDSFQNKAPAPREEDGIEVERFGRESYFVANWTGAPATAGTVAAKADELAEALEENKASERRRRKKEVFLRLFRFLLLRFLLLLLTYPIFFSFSLFSLETTQKQIGTLPQEDGVADELQVNK